MPSSTVHVLMDLLEEQEAAIQTIAVHLSTGEDLSPSQFEAIVELRRKFEETHECIEAMIQHGAAQILLRKRASSPSD